MKEQTELKPCPFCGNEVVRDYVNDSYHHDISCSTCGESFRMSNEDWNTRSLPVTMPNYHKDICSSCSPLTDKPCHICGAHVSYTMPLVPLDENIFFKLKCKFHEAIDCCYTGENSKYFVNKIYKRMFKEEYSKWPNNDCGHNHPVTLKGDVGYCGGCGQELGQSPDVNLPSEEIISSLNNLVNKIEEIHNDSRYQAVWSNYSIHGCNYNGPTYVDELNKAKEVLSYARLAGKEKL